MLRAVDAAYHEGCHEGLGVFGCCAVEAAHHEGCPNGLGVSGCCVLLMRLIIMGG